MGDKLYNSHKWSRAVRWYSLSSHQIFSRAVAAAIISKCLRKTALCHIQLGEYAQAANCTRRCQIDSASDEAATHYVSFLASVHQGTYKNLILVEAHTGHHAKFQGLEGEGIATCSGSFPYQC